MTKASNSRPAPAAPPLDGQVRAALAWLKGRSTRATLEGMARYAIPSDHAYGVAMKDIKALGKTLGHNHALAGHQRLVRNFSDGLRGHEIGRLEGGCVDHFSLREEVCVGGAGAECGHRHTRVLEFGRERLRE